MKMILFLVLLLGCTYSEMMGGYTECKPEDAVKEKEVAVFALTQINKNDHSDWKLVEIEGCQKQVVAGTNWNLSLETESNGVMVDQLVNVYEDLNGIYTLVSNSLERRSLEDDEEPGGWGYCDDDREMVDTLRKVMREIIEEEWKTNKLQYIYQLGEVISCHQQVVEGMNYKLELLLKVLPINHSERLDTWTETRTFDVFEGLNGEVKVKLD